MLNYAKFRPSYIILMENFTGTCFLSSIPLRAKPSHQSEMISQLLFADTFEVFEKEEEWLQVKTHNDAYIGWLDAKQIVALDDSLAGLKETTQFLTNEANTLVLKGSAKSPIYLHAGTTLPNYNEGKFTLAGESYQVTSSNVFAPNSEDFEVNVTETSKAFLNVPYLWGGRTHAGIDCSGFSQIVYKMLGLKINRDAWQQAEQGRVVDFLTEAKAGDLAFFDNAEGKITHVGIMLNNSQIIHASGRVKIDRIDNQGIFALDQNKYSHKLRIIKRMSE
ncbi:MAG TPA: C40 family peptidase [Pelobium sp.]|nr:C40 family peptidase [Pelobium sp.]